MSPESREPENTGPKGKPGLRKSIRQRKKQDGFYTVAVVFMPSDLQKLEAISEEFCGVGDSIAARISMKRWHRRLEVESKRKGWTPPECPEFDIPASPLTGGTMKKMYLSKDDMRRLAELEKLTGEKGQGKLVRAAIGWQYEHMDA